MGAEFLLGFVIGCFTIIAVIAVDNYFEFTRIKTVGYNNANRFYIWLAFKLPRPLVYWAAMRVIAYATQGKYSNQSVFDISPLDAVKRWESPNK